jgi:protein-S-isoprenylcysteine O-methyltransferase Ste14
VLQIFDRWAGTAWLTQFFLPHISKTTSPPLNLLHGLAWPLILIGTGLFLGSAIPLYWAKFRRQGAVTTGLYTFIRHPQYVGLALLGLGTLLLWPRFLVLITYVTMLFLYTRIASWEEAQCLAHYGESYRAYQERTGRFLPWAWSRRLPRLPPASGVGGVLTTLGVFALLLGTSVALGFGLREYSLAHITAWYTEDTAVLSPALLSEEELTAAYRTATRDARVQQVLERLKPAKRLLYVVPEAWYLPDLPLDPPEAIPGVGGHHTPADFDRRYYKLLFTRARTHAAEARGKAIVKTAYGLEPILLVRVDIAAAKVRGIETPPSHVLWGDIPTPLF